MRHHQRLCIACLTAACVVFGFAIGLVMFTGIDIMPDVPLVLAFAAVIVRPDWRSIKTMEATKADLQTFLTAFGFNDQAPALAIMPALEEYAEDIKRAA